MERTDNKIPVQLSNKNDFHSLDPRARVQSEPASDIDHRIDRSVAPTDDCPMHQVTLFQAAEYCNWLSKQDGIVEDEWIYEPNANGQFGYGMRIRGKYLELKGYRLRDEQE